MIFFKEYALNIGSKKLGLLKADFAHLNCDQSFGKQFGNMTQEPLKKIVLNLWPSNSISGNLS